MDYFSKAFKALDEIIEVKMEPEKKRSIAEALDDIDDIDDEFIDDTFQGEEEEHSIESFSEGAIKDLFDFHSSFVFLEKFNHQGLDYFLFFEALTEDGVSSDVMFELYDDIHIDSVLIDILDENRLQIDTLTDIVPSLSALDASVAEVLSTATSIIDGTLDDENIDTEVEVSTDDSDFDPTASDHTNESLEEEGHARSETGSYKIKEDVVEVVDEVVEEEVKDGLSEELLKESFELYTAGYITDEGNYIYLDEYHGENPELLKMGYPEFSNTHPEEDTCVRIYKKPNDIQYRKLEEIIDIYLDNEGYCKVEIWNKPNGQYTFYRVYSLYEGACQDTIWDEKIGNWTGYKLVQQIKAQFNKTGADAVRIARDEAYAKYTEETKDDEHVVEVRIVGTELISDDEEGVEHITGHTDQFEMYTAGFILEDGSLYVTKEYHGEVGLDKDYPEYSSTHVDEDTCVRIYTEPNAKQYKRLESIIDKFLDVAGYCKVELWKNGKHYFYKVYSLYDGAYDYSESEEIVGNWTGYKLTQIIKNMFKGGDTAETIEEAAITEKKTTGRSRFSRHSKFYSKKKEQEEELLVESQEFNLRDKEEIAAAKERLEEIAGEEEDTGVEQIVDVDATTIEDLNKTYIGNAILQCPVCYTMLYKDPTELKAGEESEEGTLYNQEEHCPHCGADEGFKLVGQVATLDVKTDEEEEEPKEEEPVDTDEPKEEDKPVEEIPEEPKDEEEEDELVKIDLNLESLDTTKFDSLTNKYLQEVYDNVESFTAEEGYIDDATNRVIIEGVIKYTSGKENKTRFVFEAQEINKRGKLRLVGVNEAFSDKKAFILTGYVNDNKLLSESLNYNYQAGEISVRGFVTNPRRK